MPPDSLHRDGFRIVVDDDTLYVIGAADAGLEYGLWDLATRFGYRQWFPGPVWEHVPVGV